VYFFNRYIYYKPFYIVTKPTVLHPVCYPNPHSNTQITQN